MLHLLPWYPGGTTGASAGSCSAEPRRRHVCPACCAGATPQAEGGHPPCAGHGQAAKASSHLARATGKGTGRAREVGGAPTSRCGTGRGCSWDPSADFGKRQEGTHLSSLHAERSCCIREGGDGLGAPLQGLGVEGNPPGRAGTPWKGAEAWGSPKSHPVHSAGVRRSRPGVLQPRPGSAAPTAGTGRVPPGLVTPAVAGTSGSTAHQTCPRAGDVSPGINPRFPPP